MVELERSDYFPLTASNVSSLVPSCPGIYLLAVKSPEGDYLRFFAGQSDNLHRNLRVIIARGSELHPRVNERLQAYECYFSYFVLPKAVRGEEAVKLLLQTSDPIQRLILSDCEEEEALETASASA